MAVETGSCVLVLEHKNFALMFLPIWLDLRGCEDRLYGACRKEKKEKGKRGQQKSKKGVSR